MESAEKVAKIYASHIKIENGIYRTHFGIVAGRSINVDFTDYPKDNILLIGEYDRLHGPDGAQKAINTYARQKSIGLIDPNNFWELNKILNLRENIFP